ncbi:rhodanese-like domain-containing protein [Endozoicomonas sp. SM1973]|uniref:Rhodanese-like domain-containing protein n=1 Tax=Spartinivicinus marinus TaxID=2994442 RepID=A0A853IF56_9GAMM|nr:rhodanese-like domain-containing protein [Spartinivicinus marinus]MCX4025858.1 rhodanese-like domain-containing protein [Spartinivicinus marinus]NYZ68674.1 rhodanese-like domain-containing protein [Spartinivicinus marinus]
MFLLKKTLLVLTLLFSTENTFCLDQSFPHRYKYKHIPILLPQNLNNNFDKYVIIDVRSWIEYNIIHITGSYNIELSKRDFTHLVSELINNNPNKEVAVYCNGHQCKKSYLAAEKLMKHHISAFAMDSGIFDWVKLYPDKTNFLGKSPANLSKLISQEEFESHALTISDFKDRISLFNESNHDIIVIDIREPFQREVEIKNIVGIQVRRIPFSNFISAIQLNRIGINDKILFIFDAVGRQIYWAQYYLKMEDVQKYYFLKGGARVLIKNMHNKDARSPSLRL